MRNKLVIGALTAAVGFLLATNPVVVNAAGQITGAQIKNNSIKGKDIKDKSITGKDLKDGSISGSDVNEATLTAVPKADGLTTAPSGSVQSGAFSSATNGTNSGYLGFSINYPRKLATPIAYARVIDTEAAPDAVHCPGPGRASAGYLCLYFYDHEGVEPVYGYTDSGPYSDPNLGGSVGVGLYAEVNQATQAYVDGIWSVGAP